MSQSKFIGLYCSVSFVINFKDECDFIAFPRGREWGNGLFDLAV